MEGAGRGRLKGVLDLVAGGGWCPENAQVTTTRRRSVGGIWESVLLVAGPNLSGIAWWPAVERSLTSAAVHPSAINDLFVCTVAPGRVPVRRMQEPFDL